MTDVHASVLAALDAASSVPGPSHSIVAGELAAAADRQTWTGEETRHLEALRAALNFFGPSDGTFRGEYQGPEEVPWPRELREVPQEARETWAAYAQAARHPVVRARLHHLLWAAHHGTPPIGHLRAAVDAYRQAVPLLIGGTGIFASFGRMQAADSLSAAYGLAVSTRQPVLVDVVAEMLDLAGTALGWDDPAPGVVAALTGPLLGHEDYHGRLRPLLELAVDAYSADPPMQVEFLAGLRQTAADDAERGAIDQRVVDSFLRRAERGDGVTQLIGLEEAAAYAQRMGLPQALEEIRLRQQRLTLDDLGLTRIGIPVQVPADFFTPAVMLVDAARDLGEALRELATATPSLPEAAAVPEDTIQGLLRLPTARINTNGPVITTPPSDVRPRPVGTDTRILVLDLHGLLLEARLERIRERFIPSLDDLLTVLVRSPAAPPDRMRGLARAFLAYFDHDDDVALELALVRVEGLLRRHLKAAGIPVIQHAQGDRPGQVSQLGGLIAHMEPAGFPPPWPTVFRLLLADPNEGMNLRNEVLHDLTTRPVPRHRTALVLQAALVVLQQITTHQHTGPGTDRPSA
ncbi:hypothetical protein [Streptomyces sp. 4F14]|uniref:hypothetical protein n=1 Tax=Streptomyces sp. 4F14 TaxID=3394380 RepID=UPI003A86C5E6